MTTIIPWGITYYEEVRVNVTLPAYICPRERHVTSTSRHAQHQRQLQVHLNAIRQRHVTSRRHRQSSAFGHVNVTSTSRQRHVTTSTRTASTSACHSSTSRHVSVTSRRHRQSQVHLNAIRQRRVTSASRHGVVANHLPSATSTSRQRQRPHRHDRHVAGPIRGPYSTLSLGRFWRPWICRIVLSSKAMPRNSCFAFLKGLDPPWMFGLTKEL